MISGAEAYPLSWPVGWKRTRRPCRSPFKTQFTKARDFLLAELRRLGATRAVLSTNLTLRLDGLPLAKQRNPTDAGAAVYFNLRDKQMVFACDRYLKIEDNIHAIGLTIEALRGIERWGASDMMERAFTGFAALPQTTKRSWREVMMIASTVTVTRDLIDTQYRHLAKIYHPDAPGGGHDAMSALNQAREDALREIGGKP